jgi:hypothetical protein
VVPSHVSNFFATLHMIAIGRDVHKRTSIIRILFLELLIMGSGELALLKVFVVANVYPCVAENPTCRNDFHSLKFSNLYHINI